MKKLIKLLILLTTFCLLAGGSAYALEVAYTNYKPAEQMALTEERDTFVIMDSFSPLRPESIPAPREDTFKKPLLSIMVPPASLSSSVEPVLEKKKPEVSSKTVSTVYFNFDSYKLNEDQKAKLDRIVPELKGGTASVYGYTCTIGSKKYNRVLSQKRAHAVSGYLKKKGIHIEKEAGMGETNASKDKKLNRKAVVKVLNKGGE
ncbi:OmpA family protein [Thermodesulfovibrio thiophilus]|uniref:OmpA family protein n=1 Tax=Thermodesulfovibrio thiophilus TaxID=340095 RepID=UPI000426709E|nr:OmpA family protein [Thermodesulfovibrio thiophilus]